MKLALSNIFFIIDESYAATMLDCILIWRYRATTIQYIHGRRTIFAERARNDILIPDRVLVMEIKQRLRMNIIIRRGRFSFYYNSRNRNTSTRSKDNRSSISNNPIDCKPDPSKYDIYAYATIIKQTLY